MDAKARHARPARTEDALLLRAHVRPEGLAAHGLTPERLEGRRLFSTVSLSNDGVLTLDAAGDFFMNATIRYDAKTNEIRTTVTGRPDMAFDADVVQELRVLGSGGDDTIIIDKTVTLPATIRAGAGDDVITGGSGDDTIDGGDGNDIIRGGRGDDTIDGDAGDDMVWGDEGDDTLLGGDGHDEVRGGRGDDTLWGGNGNDLLIGNAGRDTLRGDAGSDALYGMRGQDTLIGGTGLDDLIGGSGEDTMYFLGLDAQPVRK